MSKQQFATAPPAYQQPQYVQYAQPVQAVAVPQVQVQVAAPAGAPVLDFRSPQQQAEAARKGPKEDVDQYAWCLLGMCIIPLPIVFMFGAVGTGGQGTRDPVGSEGVILNA
eukprot:CAMPEP_0182496926 /NCGR_PEP_ID=MMETSP1321-20130603/5500_1 /TAXON_ID=91990 /ORGANISM="Bolidomonas sp., Strain RCC1657" /LENGTH=110 /DNA_ID=CAMNT_0024700665 /DNA_START=261 /DNA_END=590 /DNA_ORIENTATION=-